MMQIQNRYIYLYMLAYAVHFGITGEFIVYLCHELPDLRRSAGEENVRMMRACGAWAHRSAYRTRTAPVF
jgi:hypothetical protein